MASCIQLYLLLICGLSVPTFHYDFLKLKTFYFNCQSNQMCLFTFEFLHFILSNIYYPKSDDTPLYFLKKILNFALYIYVFKHI